MTTRATVDLEVRDPDWKGRSVVIVHTEGLSIVLTAMGTDRRQDVELLRQAMARGPVVATRGKASGGTRGARG